MFTLSNKYLSCVLTDAQISSFNYMSFNSIYNLQVTFIQSKPCYALCFKLPEIPVPFTMHKMEIIGGGKVTLHFIPYSWQLCFFSGWKNSPPLFLLSPPNCSPHSISPLIGCSCNWKEEWLSLLTQELPACSQRGGLSRRRKEHRPSFHILPYNLSAYSL